MIIGVAGKKQVGKDTVAAYIAGQIGIKHVAFATKVKDVVGDVFGLDFFTLKGAEKEQHRPKMQFIGDGLRDFDALIWVKYLFRQFPDNIVISDVRYPNEVDFIHSQGGYVIYISRDTGLVDNHRSETALEGCTDFDISIENNGTLADLYNKVQLFLENTLQD